VVELEDGSSIYAGALEVEFAAADTAKINKESVAATRSKRGKKRDKST
jgi:hypothetical protein